MQKKLQFMLIAIVVLLAILISLFLIFKNKSIEPETSLDTRCPTSGYTETSNIPYASSTVQTDPNLLSLDIYTPKSTGTSSCADSYPVMVFVHGGGWQIGDKANVRVKQDYFTSHGYVFISINYRLAPTVKYPTFNQDAAHAISWIVQNIASYKGNPKDIIIMGHSAGGTIVSSIATDESYLKAFDLPLSTVACAVSLDSAEYEIGERRAQETMLVEAAFGSDPKVWSAASPSSHVSPGKNIPPFYIAVQGIKTRVSLAQNFADQLTKAGTYSTLIYTNQLDHEGINTAVGQPGDTIITPPLQEFLDSHCK